MNLINIITVICSLLFFMIGADKFLLFLEPPCSLMDRIPPLIWNGLGLMQLAAGVLLWLPKYRKYVAGFFVLLMLVFTMIHLAYGTYDMGGSLSMAVLLAFIVWNPAFAREKNNA